MASLWIDAATAREIVSEGESLTAAQLRICQRAHAGLINARARLIRHQGTEEENRILPKGFWWAEGQAALEQDWASGDFSTWIDGKHQILAFGVQFDLSGIAELLAPEKRGAVLARYSIAGNPDWIAADDAVRLLAPTALRPARAIEDRLIEASRLGLVGARAVEAMGSQRGFSGWKWREREWDIPAWFWELYTGSEAGSRDFQKGTARGRGRGPIAPYMQINGIHFLRADIERHFAVASSIGGGTTQRPSEAPSEERAKNKGGRPPLPFVEDMLNSLWASVYEGDFQPKTQAQVKKAMQDWATRNSFDLGDSTASDKARRFFAAYNRESKNP